jgi:hypothetical protein
MKNILLSIAAASVIAASSASAAELTVFRICEDQHVLRTSDGAEAGRVEYIVVEPSSFRVVSAVVHGGVIGEKSVNVPISVFRFGGNREITLTNITRERLVSAPVFETTRLSASVTIEPTVVEQTFTHFGVDKAEITRTSTSTSTSTEFRAQGTVRGAPEGGPGDHGPGRDHPDRPRNGRDEDRTSRDSQPPRPADPARLREARPPGDENSTTPPERKNAPDKKDGTADGHDAAGKKETNPSKEEPAKNSPPKKGGERPESNERDPQDAPPARANRNDRPPTRTDEAAEKPKANVGEKEAAPKKTTERGENEANRGRREEAPGRKEPAPGKSDPTPTKRPESEDNR